MSLRCVHIIYGGGVIATALLFLFANTTIHHCAAVIVLLVAIPWFRVVKQATKVATLHDVEQQALLIADSTAHAPQPQQHQGQPSQLNQ